MLDTKDPFEILTSEDILDTPMFSVAAMIGGDQARDMLRFNREPEKGSMGTNRKSSGPLVEEYSLLMLSDQWYLNPHGIVFSEPDENGIPELKDGAHRLKAVVKASLTNPDIRVPFVFTFRTLDGVKWVLDQGKRRLPGDWLTMYGEANASKLSHAVRMLYAIKTMPFQSIGLWRSAKLTPQAQQEFLDKHGDLRYALTEVLRKKLRLMPHVGAVLYFLMKEEYGVWKTDKFFEGMATGANMSVEDPRLKLREFLSLKKEEGYKWDGFEQLGLLVSTVNAWLVDSEGFMPKRAFSKTPTKFPVLTPASKLPTTILVEGNS